MSGISFIITYYKGEQYIFTCIDSIVNSFEASSKKLVYEIILVIDSIDDADKIEAILLHKYAGIDIHIRKNAVNLGVSESRNAGLRLIKYDFFTIIDQDDYVRNGYFSVLEEKLDAKAAVNIINGSIRYEEFGIEVPVYVFSPEFEFRSLIYQYTYVFTPGMIIFNREFVSPENLFVETSDKYKGCDDLAAYLNILYKHDGKLSYTYIADDVFVYRLHSTNYSNNLKEMILCLLSIVDYYENKPDLKPELRSIVSKARKRFEFLYSRKAEKEGVLSVLSKYPAETFTHYVSSFLEKNRINRLIFWFRYWVSKKQALKHKA